MTLRRFGWLADSYGADLQRWPKEERAAAAALLAVSPQARQQLAEALALDGALEAVAIQADAPLWSDGDPDAALARLRSSVGARIAQAHERVAGRRSGWGPANWAHLVVSMRLGWPGLAAGGGLAVVIGLLIGSVDVSRPMPVNLISMLQPSPIQILSD
jgi:hypothetical protein